AIIALPTTWLITAGTRLVNILAGTVIAMGAKQSFKSRELVDSDSDEEDEEDRVHLIKKIKREHVEELTGTKKRKEIIELDEEVEIVAPKTPVSWYDNSKDSNVAMDVDSTKHPEETQLVVPTKASVTEVKALAPVLPTKLERTPFFKLHCTAEHVPFLPSGLQVPVQFEQNQPSVARWQNHVCGHYEVACEMLEDARWHFELVHQELQWVTHQHNAMALYLHDCDAVMDWHNTNNIELGEISDIKDLPVIGGFPI
ncbi:hypothetical protein C0995_012110, partial [Termitomyces sp. Mi166